MNKGEQREGVYKHVKEETVSSSDSSYHSLKKAESAGSRLKKKNELNLGEKKAEEAEKPKKSTKKKKVEIDLEAGISSLVPQFSITIKKSHLVFLVRSANTLRLIVYIYI